MSEIESDANDAQEQPADAASEISDQAPTAPPDSEIVAGFTHDQNGDPDAGEDADEDEVAAKAPSTQPFEGVGSTALTHTTRPEALGADDGAGTIEQAKTAAAGSAEFTEDDAVIIDHDAADTPLAEVPAAPVSDPGVEADAEPAAAANTGPSVDQSSQTDPGDGPVEAEVPSEEDKRAMLDEIAETEVEDRADETVSGVRVLSLPHGNEYRYEIVEAEGRVVSKGMVAEVNEDLRGAGIGTRLFEAWADVSEAAGADELDTMLATPGGVRTWQRAFGDAEEAIEYHEPLAPGDNPADFETIQDVVLPMTHEQALASVERANEKYVEETGHEPERPLARLAVHASVDLRLLHEHRQRRGETH